MQTAQGTQTRTVAYTSFNVAKTIMQTSTQTGAQASHPAPTQILPQASAQTHSSLLAEEVDAQRRVRGTQTPTAATTTSTATVNFYYDANRKRFMREDQSTENGVTTKTTTLYLGDLEIDTTIDNTGTHNLYKNYLGDTEITKDDQGQTHQYDILKDNIGSTSLITDESGNVVQRFHYDPFGEQQLVQEETVSSPKEITQTQSRQEKGTAVTASLSRDAITRYGFTGQEEIATGDIDLIHMNGRMYDPHLGRFLSPDPIIQDPSNSQSLNRYTYCLNDPLAFTDPSGFSWWTDLRDSVENLFEDAFHLVQQVLRNPTVDEILEITVAAVACYYSAGLLSMQTFWAFSAAAATNGVISYAQTGKIGAAFTSAAETLATEYAWAGTGNLLQGANWEEKSLVHGVVGGGINFVEGGSFKNGFLAAAVSEAMSGEIAGLDKENKDWSGIMCRGVAAGVVGGTVAAETGGNFENGMMTSAYGQMFNEEFDNLHNKAVLVHRPVDSLGLRDIHDHPDDMHSAIQFQDGQVWGFYDGTSVRLDPNHAGQYTIMSDSDTKKMFGVNNEFDNDVMKKAFSEERQSWDINLNPHAVTYHALTVFPFWYHHNCNDFVAATVNRYQQLKEP